MMNIGRAFGLSWFSMLALSGVTGCGAEGTKGSQVFEEVEGTGLAQDKDPFVVEKLEVDRYLGVWFEYASIPTPQSGFCLNSKAEYSLNNDGTIKVVNSCIAGRFPGFPIRVEGTARVVDTESNAILAVSFGLIPREADYRVIALDAENYSYALVTNEARTSLFVLSRTPELSESIYAGLLDRAQAAGVDITKVKLSRQEN